MQKNRDFEKKNTEAKPRSGKASLVPPLPSLSLSLSSPLLSSPFLRIKMAFTAIFGPLVGLGPTPPDRLDRSSRPVPPLELAEGTTAKSKYYKSTSAGSLLDM